MGDDLSARNEIGWFLSHVTGGRVRASLGGTPVLAVEADARDAVVDLAPLGIEELDPPRPALLDSLRLALEGVSVAHEVAVGLAQAQWRVTIQDRGRPLLSLGRGAPALTGRVEPHLGLVSEIPKLLP